MRMPKISLFAVLAGALALVACGDGSVRSPGLVGGGELQSIEIRCFRPDGGQCSNPARVNTGSTVDFRVFGEFEDGSIQDITALDRIELAIDTPEGEAEYVAGEKGRVRGLSPTDAGAPVLITASDAEDEGGSADAELEVVGGIPEIVDIFADPDGSGNCSTPADGQNVAAGQALQLRAQIRFVDANGEALNIPNECVDERDGLSWSAEPRNPDGSRAVTENTGVFSGQNTDPEEATSYNVTADLVPSETDNPELNASSASAGIDVDPATLIGDSLRITATPPRIIVGGTAEINATALFDTGTEELRLPVQLDELSILEGEDFVSIEDADEGAISREVLGLAATPEGGPAVIEGVLAGQMDTTEISVLTADFASIRLVPVGVASFADAGVFAGLSDEAAAELQETIADDAQAFGLNADGQVPFCDPDLVEDCPNSSLERNQTVPTVALPYAAVGYLQDDPNQEEAILLDDFATECDDGRILGVNVGGGDDVIGVRTMLPLGEPEEEGEEPAMEPARTVSGIRVALVEGLTEGVGTVRARLGADPDNEDRDAGVNCRALETGEDLDSVEDAEQDVRVGITDPTGTPLEISKTTFNIDKNFTCVGFTNAAQLVNGEPIRGRDKLLSSLTFEVPDSDGGTDQVIININQERATSFRTIGGPANTSHQACRNDEDPVGETDPSISIANAVLAERGVISADGATGLANNCAAVEFNPTVDPPGFAESPRTRAATVLVLPVDDAILRGESALSGEEVDGLCGELGTLFTLPIGQFAGEQGSGLLNETVLLLEQILGPILNNETIEGPVSSALQDALDALSETVLGTLLGEDGLGLLIDPLLGFLGLGGGDSPTGFALLPTLVEGLGEVTDILNEQFLAAGDGEPPPETTFPGDPYAEQPEEGEEGDGG